MKTITLTAYEAAMLRDNGELVLAFDLTTEQLVQGETVAILEPWAQLKAPPGAYNTDLPPRYIYAADKTAEPYRFRYQPPDTMPMEAVRRFAMVAWVEGDMMRLDLIGERLDGRYTYK